MLKLLLNFAEFLANISIIQPFWSTCAGVLCVPVSLSRNPVFLLELPGCTVQGEVLKTSTATVVLGLLQLTAGLGVPQANSYYFF